MALIIINAKEISITFSIYKCGMLGNQTRHHFFNQGPFYRNLLGSHAEAVRTAHPGIKQTNLNISKQRIERERDWD
jgi:hypothetical protein